MPQQLLAKKIICRRRGNWVRGVWKREIQLYYYSSMYTYCFLSNCYCSFILIKYAIPEIRHHKRKSLFERYFGLPVQQFFCFADIWFSFVWIVCCVFPKFYCCTGVHSFLYDLRQQRRKTKVSKSLEKVKSESYDIYQLRKKKNKPQPVLA